MTEQSTQQPNRYDVVVVGGGAAGLSGALTLARARRSVLVIDAGQPRNAPAGHVHGYLGLEGVSPAQLTARGREEVTGYGGEIVPGRVVSAKPDASDGFRVVLADGSEYAARRLLVTTGLVDELPDVPGVAERWGREVLHCPYCHGWEVRDAAIGILSTGPMATHQALMWRQWSDRITVFLHTGPEPTDEEYAQLAALGIAVVDGEVTGLAVTEDRLTGVRLADGAVVGTDALVVAPLFTARADVLTSLGLATTEQDFGGHVVGTYVAADPTGATDVPGVWVAGNVARVTDTVVGSAAAGVLAAAAINADLIAEHTRHAVDAHRDAPTATTAGSERHRTPMTEQTPDHEHGPDHGHGGHGADTLPAEEFWDDFYRKSERVWSGNPNHVLVREAAGLAPGTALDVGCGEGADSIWLAGRGWRVTGVDIARTALDRAAGHAAEAGVADRIDWQQHDLNRSFPAGSFDLVSVHFLHSTAELSTRAALRSAAAAVAPGGVLLVVQHATPAEGQPNPHGVSFPTSQEVLASLELPPGAWEVELDEVLERPSTGHDGDAHTRTDNILRIRRRTS